MTTAAAVKGQKEEPKASTSWLPLWARRSSSLATAPSAPAGGTATASSSTSNQAVQRPQGVAGMTLKGVGIHPSRAQSPEAIRAAADASAQAAMVAAEAAEAAPKRRPLFSFRRRRAASAALYDTEEPHAAAAGSDPALLPHQPHLPSHVPGNWPGYQQAPESASFTALPWSGVGSITNGKAADIMATTSDFELPSETRRHAAMRGAVGGAGSRSVSSRRGIRSASLADYGGGGGGGSSGIRSVNSSRAQAAAGRRDPAGELPAMISTAGPAALDAAVGSAVLQTAARGTADSSREQPTRWTLQELAASLMSFMSSQHSKVQ
jgi:hypothetical protein